MGRRIGVSLRLLLIGTVLGTGLGVLLGAWSAVKQYRLSDRAITLLSFLLLAVPVFLTAVMLKYAAVNVNDMLGFRVFEYTGEYTPASDTGFWGNLGDRLSHLVLPTLTLILVEVARYSRYQRSTLLDVLGSDYLRTARAKGLPRSKAILKHGLRTSMIPVATFFAYNFGLLLTGSIFVEKIFAWHGMGEWFIDSVHRQDVNAVAAVSLFAGVMVLVAGLLADVILALLDPRVRVG
ncbi:peptide/nickel transport system permease protein [Halopolyspora algeriensis]|uniref:Peptide/nickel transport system permease protein n=1 Tax=Halopolyspora algeriensis TaxID=1500506 RepID=A0A368VGQ7_9ACTN|nr:peptide/nickel transport system permease protein [Halopolyspora algeriensis]